MGLTIGYRLQCNEPCTNAARRIVAQFHKKATQLPVLELGGVIERMGAQTNPDHEDPRTPISWLLHQACLYIEDGADRHQVPPLHLVAFSVWVGEGAEVMNLGLAKYPETIQAPDGRLIPTDTQGWSWSSSCKTQYASNPRMGGVDHFVRVHRYVIDLLDVARDLNVLKHVSDDGGYWDSRDEQKLRESVMSHNRMVAQIAGNLKDILGDQLVSPITDFPNFEHLEADARRSTR